MKSPAELLIKAGNWEELAKYINDNCCNQVIERLHLTDLNLSAKVFVDKLAIHTLSHLLDKTRQEKESLNIGIKEATGQLQTLNEEQEELQKRLQELRAKITEIDTRLQADLAVLAQKNQSEDNLTANLKAFKSSYDATEPELKKWEQKLATDISEWNCDDVSFLLSEIGLGKYAPELAANKIDGAVLQALDTNDLTTVLQVSFKDTKRLQMYLYLVQTYHDIYTIPPGVLQWNNDTVCTWLEDNKFGHLVDVFKKNEVCEIHYVRVC